MRCSTAILGRYFQEGGSARNGRKNRRGFESLDFIGVLSGGAATEFSLIVLFSIHNQTAP